MLYNPEPDMDTTKLKAKKKFFLIYVYDISHQKNTIQNHYELQFHTHQDGYDLKNRKIRNVREDVEKSFYADGGKAKS